MDRIRKPPREAKEKYSNDEPHERVTELIEDGYLLIDFIKNRRYNIEHFFYREAQKYFWSWKIAAFEFVGHNEEIFGQYTKKNFFDIKTQDLSYLSLEDVFPNDEGEKRCEEMMVELNNHVHKLINLANKLPAPLSEPLSFNEKTGELKSGEVLVSTLDVGSRAYYIVKAVSSVGPGVLVSWETIASEIFGVDELEVDKSYKGKVRNSYYSLLDKHYFFKKVFKWEGGDLYRTL